MSQDWKLSLELAAQEVAKRVQKEVGEHGVVVVMAGAPQENRWYAAWHGSCLEVRGLLAQCEEVLQSVEEFAFRRELAELAPLIQAAARDLAGELGEGASAIVMAGRNVLPHSCHFTAWQGPSLTVRGLFEMGKESVIRALYGTQETRPSTGTQGTPP